VTPFHFGSNGHGLQLRAATIGLLQEPGFDCPSLPRNDHGEQKPVYYSHVRLGQMDERILKVEDALGRRMRNPQVQRMFPD
jgi:hypothetical protein